MKKVIVFCLLLIGVMGVKAEQYVIVAGDNVCLRSCASEDCKITGQAWAKVNTGELYQYLGESGNYYAILVKGKKYFIPKKYGRMRSGSNAPTSASASQTTSTASSLDMDKILDQYEKLALEYVAVVKKAQNGDTNALAKANELLPKVTKWANRLNNASNDMTQKQMLRLSQINAKVAAAMK